MRNNVFVVIPAFNEENTIMDVIKEIKNNIEAQIIIVDDGSEDKTSENADKFEVKVLKHILNLGQWAALKTGFIHAINNDADIIVTLDADGQHSGKSINELINKLVKCKADIVIGSRFIDQDPDMIYHRYVGIKLFNLILKLRTGKNFTDCTSGYRAYNSYILKKIIDNINENQYGSLESLIIAVKNDANIIETPIKSNITIKSSKGKYRYGYNLFRTVLKNIENKKG
jgi:glycosyltransferase involved in cell wall biosynthesis